MRVIVTLLQLARRESRRTEGLAGTDVASESFEYAGRCCYAWCKRKCARSAGWLGGGSTR